MISGSKFGLPDESLLDFSELCTLMSSLKVFKFQDLSCASMLGHVSGRLTTVSRRLGDALGDVERRLISPQQAFWVNVDVAHAAVLAPHAVGAAARALLWGAHAEHHEVLRVQRRDGGARQLRADGVHVEAARAGAVVHAADVRLADVAAAARFAVANGHLERERVLAVEEEPRGPGRRRAGSVQVEVSRAAAVAGAGARAAAAVAHEAAVAAAAPAEVDEDQMVLLVGAVPDRSGHGELGKATATLGLQCDADEVASWFVLFVYLMAR
ncbi:hypothetical protein GQ55_9G570100 [Panicum hallii var. hallii]|uniref:Uncharacterized protein n=1 Tax=Panicum hallii var. hallii TaxID=1504633 RepID=A0A2T7CFY2_9POAL|nr:hypothetical protein GQ55_9G570100 [Panicum hallii var. hallii]